LNPPEIIDVVADDRARNCLFNWKVWKYQWNYLSEAV